MVRKLLIAALVCGALPAGAATLYVDNHLGADTGTYSIAARDGSGTDGAGYMTIEHACVHAAAGDTVSVREGTYTPAARIYINAKTGTSDSLKITLRNYSTEAVIVSGEKVPSASYYLVYVFNSNYIVIQGIRFTNYVRYGIYYGSSTYGEVSNCTVDNMGYDGILFHLSNNGLISGNTVYACGALQSTATSCAAIRLRGTSNSIISGNETYSSRLGIMAGWYDSTATDATDNTISENLCHDHTIFVEGADGIALSTRTLRCTVVGNICYGNADDGIDASGYTYCNDHVIKDNIVFDNGDGGGDGTNNGDGNGIKVSTATGGGHQVIGNVSCDNDRAGFDQDKENGFSANYFVNNLAYGNGQDPLISANSRVGFAIDAADPVAGHRAYLYNNISSTNATADYYETSSTGVNTSNYNFWADGTKPSVEGANSKSEVASDIDFNEPAKVISTTFAGGLTIAEKVAFIRHQVEDRFKIKVTSDAVDAGVVVSGIHNASAGAGPLRVWFGVAPDMGPYELPVESPPAQAGNPTPSNGSSGADILSQLTWDPVGNTDTYTIYFNMTGVFVAEDSLGTQAGVTIDPGTLGYATTYYWRVDTTNVYGTTTGVTWSFRTKALPVAGTKYTPIRKI